MLNRAEELRKDFDTLGQALLTADGSAIAAIARERRIIAAQLEQLEKSEEASLVDELAAKRARTGSKRPPARRAKSG